MKTTAACFITWALIAGSAHADEPERRPPPLDTEAIRAQVHDRLPELSELVASCGALQPDCAGAMGIEMLVVHGGTVDPASSSEGDDLAPLTRECASERLVDAEWPQAEVGFEVSLVLELSDGTLAVTEVQAISPLGMLDKRHIDAVVKARMVRFRGCFQPVVARDPRAFGREAVRFVVAPDGRVSEARTVASTIGDDRMSACMQREFDALQFDEPTGGGEVRVTYPFIFTPDHTVEPGQAIVAGVQACADAAGEPPHGVSRIVMAMVQVRRRQVEAVDVKLSPDDPERRACIGQAIEDHWTLRKRGDHYLVLGGP